MNDHNPTDTNPLASDPLEQPVNPTDAQVNPDGQPAPSDYEADTRPSIGTLKTVREDAPTQDDTAADDLAALRSQSQSFMGTASIAQSTPPPAPMSAPIDSGGGGDSDAEMAKVANVQARYGDKLLQLPHVVGVGIGYMKVGDQVTKQVALVVMVDQKIEADQLQPDQRIPTQLDGVPIMVQEVGTFTAF
jgi:hypothetical protein